MVIVKQFNTAADFWLGMVVPDYNDYLAEETNLRRALHASISIFHMSDWVFHSHKAEVTSTFNFADKGKVSPVSEEQHFYTALEQKNDDFGRIRGVANAAKHLELRPKSVRPVPNAPSHAANTALQTEFVGAGGYNCAGAYNHGGIAYGASPRIMLAGPNGNDMEFSIILRNVFTMWENLKTTHGW